jgi:hypothetical protein
VIDVGIFYSLSHQIVYHRICAYRAMPCKYFALQLCGLINVFALSPINIAQPQASEHDSFVSWKCKFFSILRACMMLLYWPVTGIDKVLAPHKGLP